MERLITMLDRPVLIEHLQVAKDGVRRSHTERAGRSSAERRQFFLSTPATGR
jgi:hypothetical protein